MGASWHNCLVGCILCQKYCPENKGVPVEVLEGPEFSGEETALLLAGTPMDKMPPGLVRKLVESDLSSILEVIPRNLGVLLKNKNNGK